MIVAILRFRTCQAGEEHVAGGSPGGPHPQWVAGSGGIGFPADAGEDLGAEEFDAVEKVGVGHSTDVGLQDLTVVSELVVQVEEAVWDLVGAVGEHYAAGSAVRGRIRGCGSGRPISTEPVWNMRSSGSR